MKTKIFVLRDNYAEENDDLTEIITLEKEYEWEDIKKVVTDVADSDNIDNKYEEIHKRLEKKFLLIKD